MADFRMFSAWDNEANEMVVIQRGQAEELRPGCRSGRLVCPIDGCSNPAFTTRRLYETRWGTEVVDGFRHVVAPRDEVHTPESIRHQDGKAQVAAWLRELGLPMVSVERSVTVGHRSKERRARFRRPDVQAVARDGTKLAFEVQVSPIAADLWQQRTSELTSAGFTVTWLWAWPVSEPVNADTTAMRMQISNGSRPWFLDPQHDEGPRLASTHQDAWVGDERFMVWPTNPGRRLRLTWRPLAEHHVDKGTIQVGAGDIDQTEEHARAVSSRAEQMPTNAPAPLVDLNATPSTLRSAEAARLDAKRAEREWRASQRRGTPPRGPLPPAVADLCNRVEQADDRIWIAPVEWKSALAWRLLNRAPGTRVRIDEVINWVEREFPCDRNQAAAPVRAFLRAMEGQGAVRRTATHIRIRVAIQANASHLDPLPNQLSRASQVPSDAPGEGEG